MNTSSNGRVDRVRRPTLALNNDNKLNGAHDFNDLCLDDYGIYVFTPTSTTGRTTKSTLTSSTMATTTRKQQQNDDLFDDLMFIFNENEMDFTMFGPLHPPLHAEHWGRVPNEARPTRCYLRGPTYSSSRYSYMILLETSRSASSTSSGVAAADRPRMATCLDR